MYRSSWVIQKKAKRADLEAEIMLSSKKMKVKRNDINSLAYYLRDLLGVLLQNVILFLSVIKIKRYFNCKTAKIHERSVFHIVYMNNIISNKLVITE